MSIEAMKQALEALDLCQQDPMYYEARKSAQLACSSLRAAIAQAEQRPLSFETAVEAKADREHAENYYRQAERLLTANERTLHAEIERLQSMLCASQQTATVQQPAAVGSWTGSVVEWTENPHKLKPGTKLYTAAQSAPARELVGLTDAEKLALMEHADGSEMSDYEFMDAIESKLREKNAGQPVKEN